MVEIYVYKKDNNIAIYSELKTAYEAFKKEGKFLWVDIEGFKKDDIDELEKTFGFHPLAIEDCISTSQRPKIDQYDSYLFIILHAAHVKAKKFGIQTLELNTFFGSDYLVTVHEVNLQSINSIKERCQKNPALMDNGPSELFYLITDAMIENYFPILDRLDKEIDIVEQSIFTDPSNKLLGKIFALKKDVLALRRIIAPQRETINFIAREDYALINKNLKIYFRDVSDQLARIVDLLETYRDILTSALDGYRSTISNKTNEVMKILTVIATIMMPLTLIASIYGMNFKHMPALGSPYGYHGILILMLVVMLGMLAFFRRRKWL